MPRSVVRRAGSPFTGLGPVFMKELSDHLSSMRMSVRTLFVIVCGALPVGFALNDLRNHAHELGGDTVFVPGVPNLFRTSVTIIGQAYRCKS